MYEQICVNFAVTGLLKMKKQIIVVEDAIKELPNIPSTKEKWENGVVFMSTKEILEWIKE